jgi:plasmid stabilization system protein ParE
VTQVSYAPRARADLLRLADFLAKEDPGSAQETAALIIHGIQILERHPLVGRLVPESTMRELVISRGRTGYLALYEYDPSIDVVVVNAIRHQREAGFED